MGRQRAKIWQNCVWKHTIFVYPDIFSIVLGFWMVLGGRVCLPDTRKRSGRQIYGVTPAQMPCILVDSERRSESTSGTTWKSSFNTRATRTVRKRGINSPCTRSSLPGLSSCAWSSSARHGKRPRVNHSVRAPAISSPHSFVHNDLHSRRVRRWVPNVFFSALAVRSSMV